MTIPTVIGVVLCVVLAACAGPTTTPGSEAATDNTLVATSPVATTGRTHQADWITVKYRNGPVDVANPRFTRLARTDSSLVDAAFCDSGNRYAIITLNGTTYHYCGMPRGVWSAFTLAESLGTYYRSQIKGSFDCRSGFVPGY